MYHTLSFKKFIKTNLLRDYLLEVILSTSTLPPSNPCPALSSLGYTAYWSQVIERERQGCLTGTRPAIPGDRRDPLRHSGSAL